MLELLDITKVYRGGKRAVDDLTLSLRPGMLGLLGPNGAGKSSLMRITATVTRPTSGKLLFHGEDVVARPQALRKSLVYLPQDFGVYPNLTSRRAASVRPGLRFVTTNLAWPAGKSSGLKMVRKAVECNF